MAVDKELLEILICPNCRGEVEYRPDEEVIVCVGQCGLRYPVRDDIPVMLIDEAEKPPGPVRMELATLDDPEAVAAADPGGMLRLVGMMGEQLRQGFAAGREASTPWDRRPAAIVACGMGGSGIAGDVVRSLLFDRLDVPLVVSKGYGLPGFCGPGTLVFAISYSGDTEETVSAYGEAIARGCSVVAIGSGGELLGRANADRVASVRLPPDVPMPRAALGYLAGVLLGWLGGAGSVDLQTEVSGAVTELGRCVARWGPAVAEDRNEAKMLAAWLRTRIPVAWGSEGIAETAALRWKTQINENAKSPAFWGVLPEVDHNEVEGWSAGTGDPFGLVVLRHPGEHPRIEPRVRATVDAVRSAGLEAREATVSGDDRASSLFSLITLGDFVSTYLALLRGVDPMPVPTLSALKRRLRP